MGDDFNPLFVHFVKPTASERDRLEGLVAYALYKQAKKEWAATKSQKPTETELSAYVETWTSSPSRLNGLSQEARSILDSFGNGFVDSARAGIREDAIRGSFRKDVGAAFVGALSYSMILVVIVIILKAAGVDILDLAEKVGSSTRASPPAITEPHKG